MITIVIVIVIVMNYPDGWEKITEFEGNDDIMRLDEASYPVIIEHTSHASVHTPG